MGNVADLKHQIELVRKLHEQDLQAGAGRVWLPYALAVQRPQAGEDIRYPATARTLRCVNHHDLHACLSQRRKPTGSIAIGPRVVRDVEHRSLLEVLKMNQQVPTLVLFYCSQRCCSATIK